MKNLISWLYAKINVRKYIKRLESLFAFMTFPSREQFVTMKIPIRYAEMLRILLFRGIDSPEMLEQYLDEMKFVRRVNTAYTQIVQEQYENKEEEDEKVKSEK